ncbi:MAG TPA: NAD(P)H-hydrate dehydratase [Bacillales bacterium]|nr:NAD(P)H-hydrate dehydratase [Bacillales bacterium]
MHIVTGREMNEIDRHAMADVGLAGPMLMENAGRAVANKLIEWLQPKQRIAVMVGTGNNGGDGLVIARVLLDRGYDVDVWLVPPRKKVKGDAKKHLEIFEAAGYQVNTYPQNEGAFSGQLGNYAVVVDALLGTGVRGEPRSPYKEVITQINASQAFVVSVDLPSGVPADGAEVGGTAVKADRTVTLQCPKTGAVTYPAASYYGVWETVDIGIPPKVIDQTAPSRRFWQAEDVEATFPKRRASSHKGSHGKGLLVAGSQAMTGAAVMSAKAALRGGAGLLTAAIPDAIHSVVAAQVTEATYVLCPSENGAFSGEFSVDPRFDGVAVGPGIGREAGAARLVETLLRQCLTPLVIDADALFHLKSLKPLLKERRAPTVLTPHPGEMARLIGGSAGDIQGDRFGTSREFAVAYGVCLVLKGPYTIVTMPDGKQYVNPTGNASLAKGGTGDVLTGLILAFIMQHFDVQSAVSNAVYVHGKAADFLVKEDHSLVDVLAADVIEAIPRTMRGILSM